MEKTAANETKNKNRRAVFQALVDANPFHLPQSMIDNANDRRIQETVERVRQMTGQSYDIPRDMLLQMRAEGAVEAEFQTRSGLLMLKVIENANIDASEDEISAEVENRMGDVDVEEIDRARDYFARPEVRADIKHQLLEDRALSFLLEKAATKAVQ